MQIRKDPLSTLDAMRRQEIEYSVSDQLSNLLATIDSPFYVRGRIVMTKWCAEIADMFDFNRETVEIAFSLLDRFAVSPSGHSILIHRNEFRLAVITAFYTAVKVHEAECMSPKIVSTISRDEYSCEDIEAMEFRMLNAIKWKVHPPTAMSFIRTILDLFPCHLLQQSEHKSFLILAELQVQLAIESYNSCMLSASSIGVAALFNAVECLCSDSPSIGEFEEIMSKIANIDPNNLRDIRFHLCKLVNDSDTANELFNTIKSECKTKSYNSKIFDDCQRRRASAESPRSVST